MTTLILAAHPDDEVLGCGGTIARLAGEGHAVHVVIMAEGATSRDPVRDRSTRAGELSALAAAAYRAGEVLGAASVELLAFPDYRMDSLDRLDIVKTVEALVARHAPDTVFTHHAGDVKFGRRMRGKPDKRGNRMTDPRLRRHPLGFLEVVDRPSREELAAYYAEVYYQTERGNMRREYPPEERHVIRQRIEQRRHQAQALLGHERPGSLLDVGCGEGFVLAAFAERGWSVSGIDYSIAGVEQMNPDVADRVDQGDISAILEARIRSGERYDIVWLGNVLEHVLDPLGLMEALRLLVATGGLLVATVPNDGGAYHECLLQAGDIDHPFWIAIPDHLSYFTADSLRAVAKATGWETLAILGDFPIDLFLSHPGSNYVADRTRGAAAHRARLRLEALIGSAGPEAANRFYAAVADVGLGRNMTAYLCPQLEGAAHG